MATPERAGAGGDDAILDERAQEQRNVRNLIRWVASFVAWPALTGSIAMALFDFGEHAGHVAITLPLGLAALVVFARSQRLAQRFVPLDGGAV